MPTTVLTMLASGSYSQFTLIGSTRPAAVNSDDADTSYVFTGTTGQRESFTLTGFDGVIPETAIIEKIEHTMKIREEAGTHGWGFRPAWILNGIHGYGTNRVTTVSYASFTEEIPRPSGGNWARSELETMEWLVEIFGTADGHSQRVTYGFATVTWTAVAEIPAHIQTATAKLLQDTREGHRQSLRVPLWLGLKLELLDPFNVSHDALLRAYTHLFGMKVVGLDILTPQEIASHQLFDRWRRQLVDLIAVTEDYDKREAVLEFADLEQALATYFCSERIIGVTSDDQHGLAMFDAGGQISTPRTTRGYMLQENNVVTTASRGSFVAFVNPAIAKRNYLGLLCEDSSENANTRSVFDAGLTGYTTVLNSGTVTAGTTRKYFADGITTQSVAVVRANNAADTYLQMAGLSVAVGDGHRRIAFIYSTRGAAFIASWQLQRASDSNYWNDTSGAWQAGGVWNALPDTYDATNALEIASYVQSKAIPATTTTWTVRFGLETATTPAGGATVDVGYIGVHKGRRRFSPIPTFGSVVTTGADTVSDVLDVAGPDPVRQLWWADHGTITLSYIAEQDAADLADPSKHVLVYIQYGTAAGIAFDALVYEISGATQRFAYERFRDVAGVSTFVEAAVFDVALVRGTTYNITARNIGPDGELGLPARTMLLRASGTTGFTTVPPPSVQHSMSEKHTEVWVGSSPVAAYSRAMGIIYDTHLQPRVITDEEAK